MTEKQYVICSICGKRFVGHIPKGGDGSGLFPRKHKIMSQLSWQVAKGYYSKVPYCEGSFREGREE